MHEHKKLWFPQEFVMQYVQGMPQLKSTKEPLFQKSRLCM